jgi:acetyl-CoA carboxylase biotin carboxyl carrier protein
MQLFASDVRAAAALLAEYNLGELVVETIEGEAPFRLRLARAAAPRRTSATPAATPSVTDLDTVLPSISETRLQVSSTAVGSFRSTATPVQVGDTVARKQVLGSVESLKIPNDVLCPADGRVLSILVEEGQGVEWGQILFDIEPSS